MKHFSRVLALTCVLTIGLTTMAFAQAADDFVNDLVFERIASAAVHPIKESSKHYLYVIAELRNKNDQKTLKIVPKGDSSRYGFKFEIQDVDDKGELHYIGEAACIYSPAPDGVPACQDDLREIILPPSSSENVLFIVELEKPVQETIIYILNFLGNYSDNQYFKVIGRFDLGVKSEKGWTYAEALRVEWMFCPDKSKDLPISTCPMDMF